MKRTKKRQTAVLFPFCDGVDANRSLGVRAGLEVSYGNPPPSKGTLIPDSTSVSCTTTERV